MSSLIEGYNYDIFISYRQKDNKHDGWVTEFVNNLKGELESTFKEEISVYFDINPHDGLLETHDVDASLKEKLKCLIFIPIISRTYCDPKSFAWEHEFKAFVEMTSRDQFELKVKLRNGNVSSRVLPIQIHEITQEDKITIERLLGGVLRPVEFIYKESGVNRPLRNNEEHPESNLGKTIYRNQINKVANAIDEILTGLKDFQSSPSGKKGRTPDLSVMEQEKINSRTTGLSKNKKMLIGSAIILMAVVATILFQVKKHGISDSFESMTSRVRIINEDGHKETHRILKEEYITKLSLFPFLNEANDTSTSWLQYGFPVAVWQDLRQFNYISIGGDHEFANETIHTVPLLQEQINFARNKNSTYFLTGTFNVDNGVYNITTKIYQTSNGKVISERVFLRNDFFSLIDSISLQVSHDLKIPHAITERFTDLPFKDQATGSITSYRNYITGIYKPSLKDLNQAIEMDSTFSLALYEHAFRNYWYQLNHESACNYISRAMRHRQRLSKNDELSVRILFHLIHGEIEKAVNLSERQYDLQPTAYILERLVKTYESNFMFEKSESASERLNEIQPDNLNYQIKLARSYLFSGKYDKGLNLMKQMEIKAQENIDVLLLLTQLYIQKQQLKDAEKNHQKIISIQPDLEKSWSWIPDYISFSQNNDLNTDFLKELTGTFRSEDCELYLELSVTNNQLFCKAMNQYGSYCYPLADTDFISAFVAPLEFHRQVFFKNSKERIIKVKADQSFFWREDSLILKALALMDGNDKKAALDAFRNAWLQNPDHYYLQNFIQHLEFIHGEEYKKMKTKSGSYEGKYGILVISRKDDVLYYTDSRGLSFRLLPLTESTFMNPSIYSRTFRILSKNDKISGLEVLYHNGNKEFYPKNN